MKCILLYLFLFCPPFRMPRLFLIYCSFSIALPSSHDSVGFFEFYFIYFFIQQILISYLFYTY